MGAHEVPDEFRDRKEEYLDLLIHEVVPAVRAQGLARFFDVFCEDGVFTLEETERLVEAAARAGFGIKIHADEFVPLGGTELAARVGAVSAEHLIAITESGIAALAGSETVATLLPERLFLPDAGEARPGPPPDRGGCRGGPRPRTSIPEAR